MNCDRAREMLDALLDGRLDGVESSDIRAHANSCEKCGKALESLTMLKTSLRDPRLYYPAPDALRRKMENLAAPAGPAVLRRPSRPWLPVAAAIVLSAATTWTLLRPGIPPYEIADAAVSSHLRSVMADSHLLDFESSDAKTIKPWFAGKLKFTPPVVDLGDKEYALAGGRLDYISDDPSAAIVYRRDKHVINLFCWPSEKGEETSSSLASVARGNCNVVYWTRNEMTWCVVSDLNSAELKKFAQLLRERAD